MRPAVRTSARAIAFRMFVMAALAAPSVPAFAVDLRDVLTGYTFTSWSRKDGLVGPVWAFAQDSNGFLWLGTDSALVRFDGVRFATWEGLGGQSLPRLPIRALHVTPGGTLWVGFGGIGGVARIDNRTVTTFVDTGQPDFAGVVTSIVEDATGTVWASSALGLFRFSEGKWSRLGSSDGLPDDGAATAFLDQSGGLWVSTPDGLFQRAQASAGHFSFVEASLDPQRTISLSQDAGGRVWATDWLTGFRALGDGPAVKAPEGGRGYRLLHDRDGYLWVATIGQGLWRVNVNADGRSAPAVERATVLLGLSSDAVRTVFEDRDGNIWAGTTEGVDRLVPHRVTPWAGLGLVNTLDTSLDERVWAGTADDLVSFVRGAAGWQLSDTRVPVRGATAVRGSSAGGLWVTTANALYRVIGHEAVAVPLPHGKKVPSVESLAVDPSGEAWIVTGAGEVLRTVNGQPQVVATVPELAGVRTNAALLDKSGQLWVLFASTRVGVLAPSGKFRTFGDAGLGAAPHYDIYEDEAGTIWICGADGLSRLTGESFTMAGPANGLPTAGVYSIVQDDRRAMWLATASGIIRLDREEFDRTTASPHYAMRFRIYDTSDGLAGYPVALGDRNAVRASDGTLWFVTSRGVSVADPRRLTPQRLTPLVAIDETRADDMTVAGNVLPPGTSKIEIVYTAPELTSPLKTRFRYRLEGFDPDWIDAGARREALYTGLTPRDYTFRVAVSQDDGSWSETEATWTFTLKPRFYQTMWFYPLVAIALAAVMWGAGQFRVRQLRRQFALVLGERVRLSRELHDTLLQSLVGVALEFDAVSKLLDGPAGQARERVIKIREQVEEYIREARRSIWSLRSPALETGDLMEALRDSGARATAGHPIAFSFHQTGKPHRLSSNVQHQLLRIGQEALLNAVRHSDCATIEMRLHYGEKDVALAVADNGRGFDAASGEEATDHYGLVTMRERAQQAGGTLTIRATPGGGTTVEAVVPMEPNPDESE
jgi:signal transduction histidine kinase/ligand-binding sensor domain-containing protein